MEGAGGAIQTSLENSSGIWIIPCDLTQSFGYTATVNLVISDMTLIYLTELVALLPDVNKSPPGITFPLLNTRDITTAKVPLFSLTTYSPNEWSSGLRIQNYIYK